MESAKQHQQIQTSRLLLQEWDKGSKTVRKKILETFIDQNRNKTGPGLEQGFAQAASLFLARLTAWLRLTYLTGVCLAEQLEAIEIYLSASSGHKFKTEFIEVGGILTLLEIISLKQGKETEKTRALKCIQCIADAGRKYKELICESYGIQAIAECLAKSKSDITQDCCGRIFILLAQGNPKFQLQIYKGLIALLPCSSPKAQQIAAHILCLIQPVVKASLPSIVDPLLALLKSLHLEVQYEAIALIKMLVPYEIGSSLLKGLVSLLKPQKSLQIVPEILNDPAAPKMNEPLPVFIQQAAATKIILTLAQESTEIAEQFLQFHVVHNLLYAMGNTSHPGSQRQASLTLEYFCQTFQVVADQAKDAMGNDLYNLFILDAEMLHLNITNVQADILVCNKLNVISWK